MSFVVVLTLDHVKIIASTIPKTWKYTPVCHEEKSCVMGPGATVKDSPVEQCTVQTVCMTSSSAENANLASALAALQSALKALLGKVGL